MRRCSRCRLIKPFDNFYSSMRHDKQRYDCYCKPCRIAYSIAHYDARRQRAYNKRYQAKHAERHAKMRAAYYRRHSDRLKAKAAIYRARRKGLAAPIDRNGNS